MAKPTDLVHAARELTSQGKLIEAGWLGLRAATIPQDAAPLQIEEMRNAFFAGAQHLFASILSILDPGTDPTEADMARMNANQAELDAFIDDFKARRLPTRGKNRPRQRAAFPVQGAGARYCWSRTTTPCGRCCRARSRISATVCTWPPTVRAPWKRPHSSIRSTCC